MTKSEVTKDHQKVLKLLEITKEFNQGGQKVLALSKANMEVEKGEIVSLIGPSGSGKTTLLQIAGLLDNPTSGRVFINDIDVSQAQDQERTIIRRNNIGFVYQFHHLLPEFSALENVAMPLLIQGKGKKYALMEAEKILLEVDLKDRLNHKPSELSGGQQQRVAIARAIVAKPSLILADEPTGNLDSELAERVFDMMRNLVKIHQIACVIVTHNIELTKKTDRTILMSML